jgi:two-component system sensor histidine kinase DegS
VQYDKIEVIPALTNYLKSFASQYHMKTEFSSSGDETDLFPRTKMFLFRIVQEALSNVQKHAKAKKLSVRLDIGERLLQVTIIDDGIGFDMETVLRDPEKWDHFGIRGILERARLVGGEATIDSKKGRGTKIVLRVPLSDKEALRNGED